MADRIIFAEIGWKISPKPHTAAIGGHDDWWLLGNSVIYLHLIGCLTGHASILGFRVVLRVRASRYAQTLVLVAVTGGAATETGCKATAGSVTTCWRAVTGFCAPQHPQQSLPARTTKHRRKNNAMTHHASAAEMALQMGCSVAS